MPNQFKLLKYFKEVSWPTQLCLLAVDAATLWRVESTLISWRRQYHWQAGGPFHYSLIVELKFDGKYW